MRIHILPLYLTGGASEGVWPAVGNDGSDSVSGPGGLPTVPITGKASGGDGSSGLSSNPGDDGLDGYVIIEY